MDQHLLKDLQSAIEGDLFFDEIYRTIYSTDASTYKEKPVAVIRPKTKEDIKKIISFARKNKTSITPRTAGTSLAGQVVSGGIIVDVSRYMTRILQLNKEEHWIRVEPGVVLDELNKFLHPHGLFFGPETSTSNRCMIGGMVGNNACGSHSLIYGSTRDHLLGVIAILSDGTETSFAPISSEDFNMKCTGETLENKLYNQIRSILSDPKNQNEIRNEYPEKSVRRRNTGYAIDVLLDSQPFTEGTELFNFAKLIAGSEGTLAFITEIKLNLIPLPPKEKAVIAVHFNKLKDAFYANLIALKYNPGAIELMDRTILDLTKDNIEQQKNRFFVNGEPDAILIIEFARETKAELSEIAGRLEDEMQKKGYGYHFPVIWGNDINKVWNLRKSGLGVLSNLAGDAKPVSVIEDTAINPSKMPDYIAEFDQVLAKYNLKCVYHAHIGTGELHLRPILNLKDPKDVELYKIIATEVANLVKKFRGSLSGEHGDGRLRGEFIPFMIGQHNYNLLKEIKSLWDPDKIFNPGKITDTPSMNSALRYIPGQKAPQIYTVFDFSRELGILSAAEKCNGSADCRKTEVIGGTMCPSFMATRDEKHSTRARANILREFLTNSNKSSPFNHKEIYEIMDLCLSCKGCKSECPSSVDIAKMKAEFLQHYYDSNGIPLRSWVVANITKINSLGVLFPAITNFFTNLSLTKKILGIAKKRKLPVLAKQTLKNWYEKFRKTENIKIKQKTVYLFNDEFTNYNDSEIGKTAVLLLTKLGYKVIIPKHLESGRTYISKGLIRKAKEIAYRNIDFLKDLITDESPLIGIEPSAILTFRDEYPDLIEKTDKLYDCCVKITKNTLLIDEFLAKEFESGCISNKVFTAEKKQIKLHGHCQQKSIASTEPTKRMLSIPDNYTVEEIPSGCCGMAGSFGFEKEHYEISMKVGELVLFPAIRLLSSDTLIAAAGTSCRHQILDGTGRKAKHPVEILFEAML